MAIDELREFVVRHELSEVATAELEAFVTGLTGRSSSSPGRRVPAPSLSDEDTVALVKPVGDGRPPVSEAITEDLPQSLSRYTDLGLLGRGGMAEVRRVHDRHMRRSVAMKLLDALRRSGASDSRRR